MMRGMKIIDGLRGREERNGVGYEKRRGWVCVCVCVCVVRLVME